MYNETSLENDIALLYLVSPVEYNEYIQPACLPPKVSNNYPGTDLNGYIAGWGTRKYEDNDMPNELINAKITLYPQSTCVNVGELNDGQICAGINF